MLTSGRVISLYDIGTETWQHTQLDADISTIFSKGEDLVVVLINGKFIKIN